jgi:hypothetical protein
MTARLIATIAIWLGFVTIMIAMLDMTSTRFQSGMDFSVIAITLILSGTVALSTFGIWIGARTPSEASAALAKSKRVHRTRVDRLIETLDDDEIYELEARLLAREQDQRRERA